MCRHPFGAVLLVMSLYFCVFILDLLDVKVDDGTGLIHEYEKIRRINEDLLKEEEARQIAEAKLKFDNSLSTYQGDSTHPWENPFTKTLIASPVRKTEALQELHQQLEDSIIYYLYRHGESLAEPILDVDAEAEARMEALIKRQRMVEDRFEKVTKLPTSLRVRDYAYVSPLSDPALSVPPTPSNLDELAKKPSSVSSMFSSVVSSVFGSGPDGASSNNAAVEANTNDEHDEPEAETQNTAGSSSQDKLSSTGSFAVLADPSKSPKSASVIALESALSEAGYSRHAGPGLPLILLAYGRTCPNPKAIAAKDPGGQHAIFCAAYTGGQGVRFVFTDADAFQGALGSILPSRAQDAVTVAQRVRHFYRFFQETDRPQLVEASQRSPAPILVLQAMGAGKPQLVQASNVPALLQKEAYIADKPKIVGAPFVESQMLWPGTNRAFMVRSWLVIRRAAPELFATFYTGDIVKATVDYAPFAGREPADTTASMRFPVLAQDAEPMPFADHASNALPETFQEDLRRAAAYTAVRLGASRPADDLGDIRLVQHLCLDFVVESQTQTPLLMTVSPNCDIEAASEATKRAVTTDLISSFVSGEASSVVVDQAKGFIFS
ncbi:Hypothetical Protein FCC1311_043952 [Hondaea fermentalgiana]|uniref:Uncharacterized protein n=1 Tax=Hondaea fermentalgiana TaxID=2315210 RepID=A0A2R5GAX9_9STRA|nr:Hypothetical Protein FCC1311_043952 [Hondaea fermentalgiana]|eukprot:GBG28172.1 Hypothetical Protein FCC1311_043952 [Hondaea fermentalgiana]